MGSQQEIAEKLKKARKEAKLTQLEVAEKVNISVNYYARIERGEVNSSMETLKDLMRILNIKSLKISND